MEDPSVTNPEMRVEDSTVYKSHSTATSLASMSNETIAAQAGRDKLSGPIDPAKHPIETVGSLSKNDRCYHRTSKQEVVFLEALPGGKARVKIGKKTAKCDISSLLKL